MGQSSSLVYYDDNRWMDKIFRGMDTFSHGNLGGIFIRILQNDNNQHKKSKKDFWWEMANMEFDGRKGSKALETVLYGL